MTSTTTPSSSSDSRVVYPCTIHHTGRLGGLYTLFAESAQARAEWREKLVEAQGLRKVVQEANKVFEVETLSQDTFLVNTYASAQAGSAFNTDSTMTGQVTCSVPFSELFRLIPFCCVVDVSCVKATADGRALVAVGCAEGVWIGFRHDAKCELSNFLFSEIWTRVLMFG
jgi:RHO1 GDP-GTP exchange protein 1/2